MRISILIISALFLLVACKDNKQHTTSHKANKAEVSKEVEVHPVYNVELVAHAEKAETAFNQAIREFEGGNNRTSSDKIRDAVYEMAYEGEFLRGPARERLDANISNLSHLAVSVSRGEIVVVNRLKEAFAFSRLCLAKELFYSESLDNVDFPEAPKKVTVAKPDYTGVPVTITINDNLPQIVHAIATIKSAEKHLTGEKQQAVKNLIAESEAITQAAEDRTGKAQPALDELATKLTAFLTTNEAELMALNNQLLKLSKEEQAKYDAHMKEMKEEIQKRKDAAAAFIKKEQALNSLKKKTPPAKKH